MDAKQVNDKAFIDKTCARIMETMINNFIAVGGCPHCLVRAMAAQAVACYAFNYEDIEDLMAELAEAISAMKSVPKPNASGTCTIQ